MANCLNWIPRTRFEVVYLKAVVLILFEIHTCFNADTGLGAPIYRQFTLVLGHLSPFGLNMFPLFSVFYVGVGVDLKCVYTDNFVKALIKKYKCVMKIYFCNH